MIRPNLLSQRILARLEKELVEDLREFYGEHLRGAALFGSVVKGTLGIYSDIDLLILIETRKTLRKELEDFERYLGEKLEEKYGFFFYPQILAPKDLRKARSLGLALLEGGKVLYDPEGLLEGWLKELRESLNRGKLKDIPARAKFTGGLKVERSLLWSRGLDPFGGIYA
ncbi:nucleotidyltransferase domain-containing protein [Thermosulfurimonas marina]|uniref:Nucleotidyltransferase domain-containing protein n=1 Tax=Thermosulfurimonas marina TaxID=2047767 RepID=A0A6H1WTE3_9BACT|nr:nucleotidyltransferase domain-containing protein [Thermosulfurimonas marina]QJA06473.1 nucleotidyltransferase domain-containing protein [Thermosulfurimonas marina]